MWRKNLFLLLGIGFFLSNCHFPTKRTELVQMGLLRAGREIKTPTKVYLKDGTIILYQDGFKLTDNQISGKGRGYFLNHKSDEAQKDYSISLGDIAAMTYHKAETQSGTVTGEVIMDITALPLTFSAIYCLICPKCCFGSCPTVYIRDNGQYLFCSELFSYSISPYMEADDLDLLVSDYSRKGEPLDVRVTNEALETHYINEMTLLQVTHPKNTAVYPTSDNRLLLYRELRSPDEAKNSQGDDVLAQVAKTDQLGYRSPEHLVGELKNGPYFDHIDLRFRVPPSTSRINLLLKAKNTLLSTVLFYEIVLASQGIDALGWIEKMNTDRDYANFFQSVYRAFSGIAVKVRKGDEWIDIGKIKDMGPIGYKYVASVIPTYNQTDLWVRLEFIPDNFIFDGIFFDYKNEEAENSLSVEPVDCEAVFDSNGQRREDVLRLLREKDSLYLVTEPSDAYHFFYRAREVRDDKAISFFIQSEGYYTEWLRGKWVREKSFSNYTFNLNDFAGTFRQLAESWLGSKKLMEETFDKTRIPLRK